MLLSVSGLLNRFNSLLATPSNLVNYPDDDRDSS